MKYLKLFNLLNENFKKITYSLYDRKKISFSIFSDITKLKSFLVNNKLTWNIEKARNGLIEEIIIKDITKKWYIKLSISRVNMYYVLIYDQNTKETFYECDNIDSVISVIKKEIILLKNNQ